MKVRRRKSRVRLAEVGGEAEGEATQGGDTQEETSDSLIPREEMSLDANEDTQGTSWQRQLGSGRRWGGG